MELSNARSLATVQKAAGWDGAGARSRMLAYAGGDLSKPGAAAKYGRGFLACVGDPTSAGSYKLPYMDVVDGKLTVSPAGLAAAKAALSGARGGVKLPDAVHAAALRKIADVGTSAMAKAGWATAGAGTWNESLHPRQGGKFAPKAGSNTHVTHREAARLKELAHAKPGGSNPTEKAHIEHLQHMLGLKATGKIDSKTTKVIRDFQQKHGLKVDGIAGNQTRAYIAARSQARNGILRKAESTPDPLCGLEPFFDIIEKKSLAEDMPAAAGPLRHLLAYYMKMPHPFTQCVADNRKRFGPRTESICARLKDIGLGTTHWRAQYKGTPGYVGKSFSLIGPNENADGIPIIDLTVQEWEAVHKCACEMWADAGADATAVADVADDNNSDLEFAVTKSLDEKRRTIGVLYTPDDLDAHDEFVTADDLEEATVRYVKEANFEIRKQHNPAEIAGQVVGIIAWPHEVTVDLMLPGVKKAMTTTDLGGAGQAPASVTQKRTTLPAGTVFVAVEWGKKDWPFVKSGEISGLSMGGRAMRVRGCTPDSKPEMQGASGTGVGEQGRGHIAGPKGPQHRASAATYDGMGQVGKRALGERGGTPTQHGADVPGQARDATDAWDDIQDRTDASQRFAPADGVPADEPDDAADTANDAAEAQMPGPTTMRPDGTVVRSEMDRYVTGATSAIEWLQHQAREGDAGAMNLLRDISASPRTLPSTPLAGAGGAF